MPHFWFLIRQRPQPFLGFFWVFLTALSSYLTNYSYRTHLNKRFNHLINFIYASLINLVTGPCIFNIDFHESAGQALIITLLNDNAAAIYLRCCGALHAFFSIRISVYNRFKLSNITHHCVSKAIISEWKPSFIATGKKQSEKSDEIPANRLSFT